MKKIRQAVDQLKGMSIFGDPITYKKHPDGGRQSWIVVSGVFVAYGLAFGLLRVFSVLINPIKSYYGVSDTTAMLAPGIGMFGYSIGGLLGGPLLQTIGNREGSMIFGFVAAIAFLLCGLVANIYFILGMIFVALFSLGVVYLAAPGIISRYFKEKVTLANQLSSCGVSVGQFVLGPLLAILVKQYSVGGCFVVLGGIMMHIVSASALYRPTIILSETQEKEELEETNKNESESAAGDEPKAIDFSIFCDITFLLFFISQGIFFAGYMGSLLMVVPFAEEEIGVESESAALLTSAMGISELIFRIPFGWAGDHPKVNRTYLLGFTFIMLGVIFLAFPMCSSYISIMIFASLSGIFQGGFGGLSFVVLDDILTPLNKRAAWMFGLGLSTAFNGILGLAAPICFGQMKTAFGGNIEVLYTSAILVIVSALLTFAIVPLTNKGPKFPKIPETSGQDVSFIESKSE